MSDKEDKKDKKREAEGKPTIDVDDLKRNLERVWEQTMEVFRRGTDEVLKATKVGREKINTQLLMREKCQLLEKLGKKTVELVEKKKLEAPELLSLVKEVRRVQREIDGEEERVSSILQKKGR